MNKNIIIAGLLFMTITGVHAQQTKRTISKTATHKVTPVVAQRKSIKLDTSAYLVEVTRMVQDSNLLSQPVSPRKVAPEMTISPSAVVKSYYVELPFNKTVSVIFPSPIRSVDLGSRDIIADKAADVENVLKVKATQIGFNETNF